MSVDKIKKSIEKKEIVKRIKAIHAMKSLPVLPFDEVGEVNGKVNKAFARCEGIYLTDMYLDLMSTPNNNYVTCMDECLYNQKISLEEFKKRKISIILKSSKSKYYDVRYKSSKAERDSKAELICSRVANLYGIKTEYVAPIKNNPYGSIVVDFLSGNEQLEDFYEFTGRKPTVYAKGSSIGTWMELLRDEILNVAPGKTFKKKYSYVRPMIKDLVKQYLFKKYIIHDADFCYLNLGIVRTPDYKKLAIAPIYDFEMCLLPGMRSAVGEGLKEDIEYLVKYWPGLFKSVIDDFSWSHEKKQGVKSIVDTFETDETTAYNYNEMIKESTVAFLRQAKNEYKKQNIDLKTVKEEYTLE